MTEKNSFGQSADVNKSGYMLWRLTFLVTLVCAEFSVVQFFIAVK